MASKSIAEISSNDDAVETSNHKILDANRLSENKDTLLSLGLAQTIDEKPQSDDVNGLRLKTTRKLISEATHAEAPKSLEESVRAMQENFRQLEAEVKRLSSRRKKRETVGDEQGSSKLESVNSDEESGPTMRVSIPKLNYITSDEMDKSRDPHIPIVHHAIDVLCEESMVSSAYAGPNEGKISESGLESLQDNFTLHGKSQTRRELPERIRINSRRIQCALDYDICGGRLDTHDGLAFSLVRPFKLLDYHQRSIWERLLEFEEARQKKCSKTEKEYMALLASDPVSDEAPRAGQIVSNMTVSELTATITDLRLLVGFIDQTIKPVQAEVQSNPQTIHFSELWHLFRPGSFVYVKDAHIPQAVWKVIQRTGGRRYIMRPDHITRSRSNNRFSPFVLDCYYLDYNGNTFLPICHQFKIDRFDGLQAMTSLPVMPFEFAVEENLVNRESLMRRGQQFLDNTKVSYRYYSGRSQNQAPDGTKLSAEDAWCPRNILVASEIVESQVMIDFDLAFRVNSDWLPHEQEPSPHQIDDSKFRKYGLYGNSKFDPFDRDIA